MFNKENIQLLIDELKAHQERFNMVRFVQYGQPVNGTIWKDVLDDYEIDIHDCNTVCCISGWIQILRLKQRNARHGTTIALLSKGQFSGLGAYQFLIDYNVILSKYEELVRRGFIDNLFIPRAINNIGLYGLRENCPWCQSYKLGLLKNLKMDEDNNEIPDFYAATAEHAIAILEGMIAGTIRPNFAGN
jgi:hypothetical protein